ncbi:aldehyde dehydrogenase domain-containing protein [Exophiala viscosa]|uniref:aldehyde dehydrogenase domain-containing protein n=1 Tax=Exophiala viscosa TaxID=2486360 RepID=UPI0021921964|nr:aldehyde dehydrogenase domain-containing protein [Exophiala viscosa]
MSTIVELSLPNGHKYEQPVGLFIDNQFVKSSSGKTFETIDPSTEEKIVDLYEADADDVDIAVKAARAAFEGEWSQYAAEKRGMIMSEFVRLVEEIRPTLAAVESWDSGKPYSKTLYGDVSELVGTFRYYAGWADKVFGRTIETDKNKLAYTMHQPIGVCGQIIPWNFPLSMWAWKVAPAVATGCTVVIKTAEQTPLSALFLGPLIKKAGFPPGVINIISGFGKTAGAALASHLDVDKIAFTGSTATGRNIMKMASVNLKAITLECGGKSPLIVCADANIDKAVQAGHSGIMYNAGQVCTATSRIFVHEDVYDKYVDGFKQRIKDVSKVGHPFEKATSQGPQVSKTQRERVLGFIEEGKKAGAKVAAGGNSTGDKGYYIEPTVFTDAEDASTIMQDEIFGPVASIAKFSDYDDAVRRANNTSYGLAAAVFTQNITRGHRIAEKLQVGMVWINSNQDSHYGIPFGGWKSSGIGRELGEYGLNNYTNVKAVHVNLEE